MRLHQSLDSRLASGFGVWRKESGQNSELQYTVQRRYDSFRVFKLLGEEIKHRSSCSKIYTAEQRVQRVKTYWHVGS